MNIEKLLPYHSDLNPEVWDGFTLDSTIRDRLLEIAEKFKEFLDVDSIKVYDVILTGSLANYNYTSKSDFDLHLVIDHTDINGDLAEKFLQAKKTIWNDQHDITIKGYDVELYPQDISEPHHSTGTYSLQKNQWIVKPKHQNPDINHLAVKIKSASLIKQIDSLINNQSTDISEVEILRDKIRKMRQSGLQSKGEFSTENLTFKVLRNEGYLDKLWDYGNNLVDRELSLESKVNEFAPSNSGDDGFSEETLKMLASQWYNGDEDPQVERTLAAAGWEIGQDEGYDDEPGVFVVMSGDVNGDSFISWPAGELKQSTKEDAAGVGIVTKQNTTKDVNKGTLKKMMKGFKLV